LAKHSIKKNAVVMLYLILLLGVGFTAWSVIYALWLSQATVDVDAASSTNEASTAITIELAPSVTNVTLEDVLTFAPFREWLTKVKRYLMTNDEFTLHSIKVLNVYMFGSQRIGFVFLDAHITHGRVRLPGAVLLRGNSAAVLLWYVHNDTTYVVAVRQPRVAMGDVVWEVPAGMVSGDGSLRGTMFDEIREETGIDVNVCDLRHHADTRPFTSCGLLDERLCLFSAKIDASMFNDRAKTRGNTKEGEVIVGVEAMRLDDMRIQDDAKFHTLLSVTSIGK
jgi:hypothetical protein